MQTYTALTTIDCGGTVHYNMTWFENDSKSYSYPQKGEMFVVSLNLSNILEEPFTLRAEKREVVGFPGNLEKLFGGPDSTLRKNRGCNTSPEVQRGELLWNCSMTNLERGWVRSF